VFRPTASSGHSRILVVHHVAANVSKTLTLGPFAARALTSARRTAVVAALAVTAWPTRSSPLGPGLDAGEDGGRLSTEGTAW